LAIIGHYFDKATHFPWLVKAVSSDTVNGLNALDLFAQNRSIQILPLHPGFEVLLKRWPNLSDKDLVRKIGSGGPVLDVGARIKPDIVLIAYDLFGNVVEPKWRESLARQILLEEQSRSIFKRGETIFFIGIIIAFVSGLLKFPKNRPNT
jgi:hypothetical protein